MKKLLIGATLCAGLMGIPELTNDTDAYKNIPTPRTEEVIKTIKNDVLFTIDDWPSKYMLDIAKTLDASYHQWIFFIVGKGITKKTKQDIITVIKMWHHIWNHSFSHPNFHTLSFQQAKDQIIKSDALIAELYKEAGIPQWKKYIRYPFGNNPPIAYRNEFNIFLDSLWYEKPMYRHMDVMLNECKKPPTDKRIAKMKQGDTILVHERPWTVETIERVCEKLDHKKEL